MFGATEPVEYMRPLFVNPAAHVKSIWADESCWLSFAFDSWPRIGEEMGETGCFPDVSATQKDEDILIFQKRLFSFTLHQPKELCLTLFSTGRRG